MDLGKVQWLVVVFLACAVVARKYDDSKVYVHLVPHTHDDVGWLKTVDEYYYGANKSIQQAAVQYILDTVVQELQKNSNRTFIYVEIAFFARWWNQQSEDTKQVVKKLVSNKQLEFVNAGWCMNDEAATDYNAIIDQMSEGLRFVQENFGDNARPRVAWQIDPFGHSSEQAAIFANMGFDGLFFGRHDYDDRNWRLANKTMEMVWRPSKSLGEAAELFTGILYNHYAPPKGFCFDVRQKCTDDPIQDDPSLMDYNVDERVKEFVSAVNDQRTNYRTKHIMMTMGGDFEYEDALEWFKNLDKLIKYTNEKYSDVEVLYSTPSRYLDALHDAGLTWTVKTDDFFPYADSPWDYWTGYFTSRPALKRYVRKMNSLLQSCRHMEVMAHGIKDLKLTTSSTRLAKAMGVAQHHDAVSGTEKQHVAYDYAKRLHIGQVDCTTLMAEVAGGIMTSKSGGATPTIAYCEYLNISVCPQSPASSFDVMVYNPLGQKVTVPIRFPVATDQLTIMRDNGTMMTIQTQMVTEGTTHVRGKRGSAQFMLTFMDTLPAVGGVTYFVRPMAKQPTKQRRVQSIQRRPKLTGGDIQIGGEGYPLVVTFDGETGHLKSINNTQSNLLLNIDQWFMWWNSSDGRNVNSSQASGAYIFRPNGTQPFDVTPDGKTEDLLVVKGDVYMEVYQKLTDWVYQQVRVYRDFPGVQFQYTVGPIPFKDGLGKEVISRFTTDLATDSTWYTDANGREMQERKRNYRPTWKYNNTEPVAGNYYPVNSRIYMRDTSRGVQLTVMSDCSQGGSSLNDGQLELMVHRRMLHDDKRGVGEPLNETGVNGDGLMIRGSHVLFFDTIDKSTVDHRVAGAALMLRPEYLFIADSGSPSDFTNKYHTNFSMVVKELPTNVHLLTLQDLGDGTFLLRLEHLFEEDEGDYGKSVTVSLSDVFADTISVVKELALGANTDYPVSRLKWDTDSDPSGGEQVRERQPVLGPLYDVELNPMEIRTFLVKISL